MAPQERVAGAINIIFFSYLWNAEKAPVMHLNSSPVSVIYFK